VAAPAISQLGTQATIIVDGDPSDWVDIPPLITDATGDGGGNPDLISVRVANDDNFVFILAEFASPPGTFTYLQLDTDLNPTTGCVAFGIGVEYGITFSIPSGGYIGDARDCSWESEDFPGALVYVVAGNFIEASIPISTLEVLSPGLTAFDITAANDLTIVARYNLAFMPPPVGGSVTGVSPRRVICLNRTTGQRVTIPLGGATSWDCGAAGLVVNPGDTIRQTVVGTAN
jgi:hypothetical protein